MIYGIGIDLCDVRRMRSSYERFGERLAERILTPAELEQFRVSRRPVRFLAMRFAAKEAASKAFGTGFREGVALSRIGVRHDRRGKPSLVFLGPVANRARRIGITAGHVSLTDEQDYAVAYVVLETADREADGRRFSNNSRTRYR